MLGPAAVVTMTSTVPADSGGDLATRRFSDFTVTLTAAIVPKATVASEVNPVPATKTLVPPVVGLVGDHCAYCWRRYVPRAATPNAAIKKPTGSAAAERTKPNLRYMIAYLFNSCHAPWRSAS